ncbi:MAG: 2OG-Fe dioxygenase family protein [Streptomycetaceae bacterium]|nr:2OG-Fe dioxygenase family protein [Streptomycetaceae bacterium]
MAGLLKGLGATETDIESIKQISGGLPDDPTLLFRKSKNGRFCFDIKNGRIDRLEFQPFILSADEDFVRHDSGQVREFSEISDDLQLNSVLQGLLRFQAFMVQDIDVTRRPKLDYDSTDWVCTLFNLRTVTTPEMVGEPALEGVHSDGVDHTMTTLLGSENMTDDSAITFLHDMREKNAIR